MRILQLCHKTPFPPSDGGSIAMHQITQGLLDRGIEVKVIAVAPYGSGNASKKIPDSYIKKTRIEIFPIDTRVKPLPAFINLFTRKSYNISRFFSGDVVNRLAKLLQEETFDIIQLEGLFLTPYIPVIRRHTGTPLLFRSHNIEHFIWERLARSSANPLKKLYLRLLARRLKIYEMKTVHQIDGLIAISPVDMHFFKKNGFAQPGITIPVGIDTKTSADTAAKEEKNTIFHIGAMDWRPNQDGILWFLQSVWPLVAKENSTLRFVLAGKNIPDVFYQYAGPNVEIAGEVPDAKDFMLSHQLMVVPLHSGGGMRVKIIEGMAAAKPIISTSIGAEGINCTHGENILLADTAREMAEAILHCFNNPEEMNTMGIQAQNFVRKHHNIEKIIDDLISFYKTYFPA
jgi:polysaccharide biosynthesis protein PslH